MPVCIQKKVAAKWYLQKMSRLVRFQMSWCLWCSVSEAFLHWHNYSWRNTIIHLCYHPKSKSMTQVACPSSYEMEILFLTLTMEGWSRRLWISISVVTREVMSDSFILCMSFFLSIFWKYDAYWKVALHHRSQISTYHFDRNIPSRSSASSPVHRCKPALSYLFRYLVVLHTNKYRIKYILWQISHSIKGRLWMYVCWNSRINTSIGIHTHQIMYNRIYNCVLTLMLSFLS